MRTHTRTHIRFRIGFHKSFAYDGNEEALRLVPAQL